MNPVRLTLLAGLVASSLQATAFPVSGIEFENFDRSVRIQDNLYLAVNGTWIKKTAIPADKSSWGAIAQLRDQSDRQVRALLDDAASGKLKGSDARKISDLYKSFMNEEAIERAGLASLRPDLAAIESIGNRQELITAFATAQRDLGRSPLAFNVVQDSHDANRYQVSIGQSGLALPDRDYYLLNDARFVRAREAYQTYLTTLFRLAGYDTPEQRATAVLALETRLARIQWSRVDNRDARKTDNPLPTRALATQLPGIDWATWLAASALDNTAQVNIRQPSYLIALGKEITASDLAIWKDYLLAGKLSAAAPYLPKAFADAHFALFGKVLQGQQEPAARWQRGVQLVNSLMGEAVGKYYVARHFPAKDKARMETLVANLLQAYRQSIDTIDWMSPETKQQAQAKLAKYTVKIGYPDTWRDYGSLHVQPDDPLANLKAGTAFNVQYMMNKLGKPVDRQEWGMSPQTVNAYYSPQKNEIVFPAAILQAPFFNSKADDAVNYGAIGAVIGHEISHGFDDQGSHFDGDGNLKDWWSAADREHFDALSRKLIAQYSAVEPVKGQPINGRLTLGENIADLSGLQIAYQAYRLSLGGKAPPTIDGLSGDKRFFIGFAQAWRSRVREEALVSQLVSDPHSPSSYRPIGAAINSDAFHKAFGIQPGDGMYKPESERIRIW